jgi:hypothetical protein
MPPSTPATWFILDGHKVLVADMGEPFVSDLWASRPHGYG